MRIVAALACALPLVAGAVQLCEMNGQPINPNDGNATAGKTGLMRCRDGENGPVVREQEYQRGVAMGVMRYFQGGVLQKEYSVNERGNHEGRAREFAATPGPSNPVLRDETYRNGTTIGLVRTWYPSGTLKRTSFHGDDGREQAVAEFTPQGKLAELRCAATPQLGLDADDAAWCGHRSAAPVTVELFSASGSVRGRITHERGERRKIESLWDSGEPREQTEITSAGGSERSFSAQGVKRRELVWITQQRDGRPVRVTTLEREFHETGALVHEKRWTPSERGGELQSEQHWYLNGQPRDKLEVIKLDGQPAERRTSYHDNGRVAVEGVWLGAGRGETIANGVHKHFDDQGRVRAEQVFDARGRISREREFDEAGQLTRDDEVFEDGSRKSRGRQ